MEMKLAKVEVKPDRLYIIAMCEPPRIGAMLFSSILEYWKYPPRTPSNALYELGILKFGNVFSSPDPMQWFVMSIPLEDKVFAEEAAKKSFVEMKRTIPIIMEKVAIASLSEEKINTYKSYGKDIQVFPMSGPNVYTLENESGYAQKLNGDSYSHYLNIERQLCHKIMGDDDKAATEVEMAKFRDLLKRI